MIKPPATWWLIAFYLTCSPVAMLVLTYLCPPVMFYDLYMELFLAFCWFAFMPIFSNWIPAYYCPPPNYFGALSLFLGEFVRDVGFCIAIRPTVLAFSWLFIIGFLYTGLITPPFSGRDYWKLMLLVFCLLSKLCVVIFVESESWLFGTIACWIFIAFYYVGLFEVLLLLLGDLNN